MIFTIIFINNDLIIIIYKKEEKMIALFLKNDELLL